ncbi:energy transducer TonB [Bizionia myxarmorum]|uniref:TonB C-terminal domain-containing protein n=1 Tax=Bizionia myxarmorum TaxID=291186 RepID=A0A5D0R9X7_9FLAO|nr:hypothetical protein [Bizionia myxarmorum]TYB78287.1 hypothetical protein ES674_00460 [Bizionia myxarmorum]
MKYLLCTIAIFFSLNSFSQEPKNQKNKSDNLETSDDSKVNPNERVPIYKGCNKSLDNKALKACFNEKINKHVGHHFNEKIAEQLDIPDGSVVKINVFFKVSTSGQLVDIQARAPFPELEAEAIRVMTLVPEIEPGYIDGEAVRVPFFVPIIFTVTKAPKNAQYPSFRGCEDSVSFEDLKNCTINKIMDYVKVSVNYELADALFPLEKSTQFQVSFTINEKGKAEDISAKAHHKEMAAEAIRILKRMPKMKKPGFINGKPAKFPVEFLMTIYF